MAAAAACMITPAAARPLLPTPRRLAGRPSDRSGWENKKMPGRASASTSWTKDKLVARTSATVPIPSRASLSDSWTKDKTERKEASVRVGRPPSREESPVKGKRASSRALSVVVERSEKKAKPEENAEAEAKKLDEDVVEAVFYAGPAFVKSPDPSEVPLPPKFLLLGKSPEPSDLPVPWFLMTKAPKATRWFLLKAPKAMRRRSI
ncbi:hypothetical protein HU200_035034 [Digitaria exilis]|uniref:Uncharacterized protein n=1 Tax=Digitaria exilis TaxID=1010633 RepID=A0A835EJF0_9POAL|nr:hypothetical protein HU200_035034 [Digitaria exilis]